MLDPNNIVPLYEQAANALREDMRKGVFLSGNRLPTESELAQKYGISRITIRHAIDQLVKEGLVERKQGTNGQASVLPSSARRMGRRHQPGRCSHQSKCRKTSMCSAG